MTGTRLNSMFLICSEKNSASKVYQYHIFSKENLLKVITANHTTDLTFEDSAKKRFNKVKTVK